MKIMLLAPAKSIHTIKWLRYLVGRGHEIHIVTAAAHYAPDAIVPGAHYQVLNGPLKTAFGRFASLRRIIHDVEPTIVHAHYASSYGMLARLTRFHPYVLSVWGSDVLEFPYRSPLHAALIRANLRAADRVCSTSEFMAEQVKRLTPRLKGPEVIPFGVDTEVFRPDLSLRNPSTFVVGTVKTLAHEYGIDILIRAFAIAKSEAERESQPLGATMRLVIVGGGPQRSELEKLTRALGVHKVTEFVGAVPNDQVPLFLNRFDVYAALSREESFGVAVVEASACELPVLVTRVEGLPEVVVDGSTGFMFEEEDVQAAASAILRLMNDSSLRRRMGEAGRRYVIAEYTWSDNAAQMERIYAEVVGIK